MSEAITISSLGDLVERLFAKLPSVQKVTEESAAPYLNSPVSDIGEAPIQQLFLAENISSSKEQREYNEHVSTGTLLHLLAFVGRHEAVEWLLKSGAYVHTKNKDGSTPLHVAALNHHPETIRVLRFYHADAHTENKQGKTAVDFSKEDDVKEALLEHRFSAETIEDEFLQERFDGLIERVTSPKSPEDELQSLLCIRSEIRISTASMTSVPKPLKFLRDNFSKLEEVYTKKDTSESKLVLADILSVLAMAVEDAENKCLRYRLEGSSERVSSFGHPYIRRLCSQMPDAWTTSPSPEETLLGLVRDICVYCLEHSAEAEACDLLMEIERVELIVELVAEDIFERVCLYLTSCVKYVPEPEDSVLLHTALKIFRKFHCYPQALRLALMLNDLPLVKEIFLECPESTTRKQLAFILGRQQVFLELDDVEDMDDTEDLVDIMSNIHLNNNFIILGRELDILDPKVPEDIYKTHLEHARFSTTNTVDSARANLASSFVNAFVNCAFGDDKLLTTDGNKWIYKHKNYGMLSATASLGLILLWDVDGGLTQIDKLLYTNEDYIKSGALLALGLVNVGVRNECDPALALLSDYVLHASNTMRLGAIIGLGLAYAGSMRSDIIDVLTPVMWDDKSSFEVVCLGALSCALIAVGGCHGDLTESILQIMLERDPGDLAKTSVRFLTLALALLYLGKQEAVEATVAALKAVPEPLCSFAVALLETCAYAGTGNVLKIQSLLHVCSEYHKPKEEGEEPDSEEAGSAPPISKASKSSKDKGKKSDKKKEDEGEPGSLAEPGSHQSVSVLGIALIAMGEDIGAEMAMRTFNHLLHYGDPPIRRAVPLALALLSTSNPQLAVLDMLHKFSHDSDPTVARNAIFAMGLVGCGTNNARLAGMLRNLAQFYHKEPQDLFMVRLAQGLTHLGKGTLTLNPYHSDRMLLTPVSLAGLLIAVVSMLDASNIILKDAHYMLFYLAPAIQTRMLVTFDEELNPLPVTVRVGQAVDVVGQAGKPKTITGFQTHTTPVLLGYGERAELATEEYVPLTSIVEGFVILKKNPDYEE